MSDNTETSLRREEYCLGVPHRLADRLQVRQTAGAYIVSEGLVPPVPLDSLKHHAQAVLKQAGLDDAFQGFAVVMLNNALWQKAFAKVPFEKRLLLLPQCLKHSRSCPADQDHLGLICRHCGRCVIDRITRRAEALGYAVLIAEGSPVVMAMIESGQIQATLGVSCLSVLERVFPYMEAAAVPGMAIPLLKDGCRDTVFDEDELMAVLESTENGPGRLDITALKHTVQEWFEPDALRDCWPGETDQAAIVALEWMSVAGKRYRPLLTAGVYAALSGSLPEAIPPVVRRAAVAVECFHKASLAHDDIEDGDAVRYDKPTLHQQYGVPVALNAGDYLVGLGYQLLSELDCPNGQKVEILKVASEGHRLLCAGQGDELACVSGGQQPDVEAVLSIFARKTSPAFAVALKIGAILAGADKDLTQTLDHYSEAIGVAYQIRDDLQDARAGADRQELSILDTLALQADSRQVLRRAEELLADSRRRAIAAMEGITQSDCKAFLRKVITKIFDETERMGCCDEYSSEFD